MDGPLEWIAAIGSIIAAALIAADLGRKVTGWAFVLFVAVALLWVVSGALQEELAEQAKHEVAAEEQQPD